MHKAARLRQQKTRELQEYERRAELYSQQVNAHIDGLMRKAFALSWSDRLEYVDATYLYDAMERDLRDHPEKLHPRRF